MRHIALLTGVLGCVAPWPGRSSRLFQYSAHAEIARASRRVQRGFSPSRPQSQPNWLQCHLLRRRWAASLRTAWCPARASAHDSSAMRRRELAIAWACKARSGVRYRALARRSGLGGDRLGNRRRGIGVEILINTSNDALMSVERLNEVERVRPLRGGRRWRGHRGNRRDDQVVCRTPLSSGRTFGFGPPSHRSRGPEASDNKRGGR
jgi:hypothetical protein